MGNIIIAISRHYRVTVFAMVRQGKAVMHGAGRERESRSEVKRGREKEG
jgi:hypothetical protein